MDREALFDLNSLEGKISGQVLGADNHKTFLSIMVKACDIAIAFAMQAQDVSEVSTLCNKRNSYEAEFQKYGTLPPFADGSSSSVSQVSACHCHLCYRSHTMKV